jgi:aspartate carbamoyltransferase regulatory subunit
MSLKDIIKLFGVTLATSDVDMLNIIANFHNMTFSSIGEASAYSGGW